MTSMSWSWRYLSNAAAAAGLSLTPPTSTAAQVGVGESCTVSAGPSQRLELPDGRIVSVDAQSAAASGGSIMALGRYVYTFPVSATSNTSPLPQDSLVGALIDANSVVRLVPSPLRNRSVLFARAAGGPAGSFHVLFVTGIDSVDNAPTPVDTATIWYARFTNGTWESPQQIARTRGARLDPEFTSELLEHSGELSFVFPSVDIRDGSPSGGLILLRRMNGVWSSDTLRTYRMPSAVRARHAPNGALTVLFAQIKPGAQAEEVYLSSHGSQWSTPRRIGGNGVRPISDLALTAVPDGLVASWATWQWLRASTNVLEWARVRTAEGPSVAAVLDSGAATYPFELVTVADEYPLWLYQGEPHGSTLAYALAAGTGQVIRGHLTIPFHNSRARAVTELPSRTVVFTMKRGSVGAGPMIASWMTDLRIRCPHSARR